MLLKLNRVDHKYPGAHALKGVNLTLDKGEVLALVGENGAGKSTLIKVITGALVPDSGQFDLEGEQILGKTPANIRQLGIETVYQEFSIAPDLSVLENIFLGRELKKKFGVLSHRAMEKKARDLLNHTGFKVDLHARAGGLSRGAQQITEILKALLNDPKVLVLDEPTASLDADETKLLFSLIVRLKTRGTGVIFVTHRMDELMEICDRALILRDGSVIDSLPMASLNAKLMTELMTGRQAKEAFPLIPDRPKYDLLEIKNLRTVDSHVADASLTLKAGEIVGLAGLVGSGKSHIARACFGLEEIKSGGIFLCGEKTGIRNPRDAIKNGFLYFPADRNAEGLALCRTIKENIIMGNVAKFTRWFGHVDSAGENSAARKAASQFTVKCSDLSMAVDTLSGGNRQKVVLSRAYFVSPRVYLFDEPTVGIDVGAKREVYDLIKKIVQQGGAVLFVSSDLSEIVGICDRAYVIRDGTVASTHEKDDLSEKNLLPNFFS